jgi:hypothetical protein
MKIKKLTSAHSIADVSVGDYISMRGGRPGQAGAGHGRRRPGSATAGARWMG